MELITKTISNTKLDGIVYGESGVGKTYTTATTAKGPVLRLEFPKGEGQGASKAIDHLNIPKLQITTYPEFVTAYCAIAGIKVKFYEGDPEAAPTQIDEELAKKLHEAIKKVKPKDIIFDSLTSFLELILQHSRNTRGNKGVKNWSDLSELAPFWVDKVLALPQNICMLALRGRQEDEHSGRVMYQPELPGKAAGKAIFKRLDYMLHLYVGPDGDRRFRVQTGDDHVCKLRIPPTITIPDTIPASLQDVNSLIEQAKGVTKKDGN